MKLFKLDVSLVDATREVRFSEHTENLEDRYITEEGIPDFGAIYKFCSREYGRCVSSMYRDVKGAPPRRIGWVFHKRVDYDRPRQGSPKTYLQEAWICVVEVQPETRTVLDVRS